MKYLVIDSGGLHVETARRLGKDGNKVWYFSPWFAPYPLFDSFAPGVGVPEIEKVLDYGPYIDEADVIVFPDVGMGKLAHYLRQKGKTVFAAGLGDGLELDREFADKTMKEIGIKTPETFFAYGIDNALDTIDKLLKEKTETNQNAKGGLYIKFNIFRGSSESFPVANIDDAHFMFDVLRSRIGPYSAKIPVCIQREVKGVECGADCFFDGIKFITPTMVGFESGGSYIGYLTDDFSIYKPDLDKLTEYFRAINYRGAFSFECIYDGKDCYWIDPTPRFPMPLGLMYNEYAKDFPKLISDIAKGQCDDSTLPLGRYIGCMEITSEEALHRWLPLKGGDKTKFFRYLMIDDKYYSVPGNSLVGVVLGEGDSMDAVQEDITKNSEDLSIYFASFNPKVADDIRAKYVEPMAKLGFKFGNEKTKVSKEKKEEVNAPANKIVESINKKKIIVPKNIDQNFINSLVSESVGILKTWGVDNG